MALLFLTAGMIALAGCDGRPAATLARPDSTKNAAAEVARGTDPDDAQGAGASDSVTHSRMSAGANDTATVRLNPGRSRHDEISYSAAIRAGRKALANWPAIPAVLPGAILPQYRVVAYYGNRTRNGWGCWASILSRRCFRCSTTPSRCGVSGSVDAGDSAIHLVAVVAQGYAGPDRKWRLREGPDTIEQAYRWAQSRQGLLFVRHPGGPTARCSRSCRRC